MQQLKFAIYPKNQSLDACWFIKYTHPTGKGYAKAYINSIEFPTKEARLIEAERRIQEIKATWQQSANIYHHDLLKDLYTIVDMRCMGKKQKTKDSYWGYYNVFSEWYKQFAIAIDQNKVGMLFLKHLLQKKYSNTTHNNYRRNFKSYFVDLISFYSGKYTCNCFNDIRVLPEQRKTKQWFEPGIQQQLKNEISLKDPELWLACLIQYYCFIRPNELRQIKIKNINFNTKTFEIPSANAKSSKLEYIPIPEDLLEKLKAFERLPGQWYLFSTAGAPGTTMYGRDAFSSKHKKFVGWLNLDICFTFYGWKNTGAVELVKNGTHMKVISMLMRHSSIEITDEYLKSLGINDLLTQSMIKYKIL